jgi:hypothetical protein
MFDSNVKYLTSFDSIIMQYTFRNVFKQNYKIKQQLLNQIKRIINTLIKFY